MKKYWKRLLCLLMAAALLCTLPVALAEERGDMDKEPYADALNRLGLFLGTEEGYSLENSLTREQAITLVVRFLGAEETALEENNPHPFTDVAGWASPYVGYAYTNGITKGVSAARFGADKAVTEPQFMTFLLRLLGYEDGTDFTWDAPYALAEEVGMVPDDQPQSTPFTRGCAVVLCWRLLTIETLQGDTLAERLMDAGVFTSKEWKDAQAVAQGKDPDAGGHKPSVRPDPDPGPIAPDPGPVDPDPGPVDPDPGPVDPGPGTDDPGTDDPGTDDPDPGPGGTGTGSTDNNETEDVVLPF